MTETPTPDRPPRLLIDRFALGAWETNCYVVRVEGSPECWIIDAGMEPDELLNGVGKANLQPSKVILTHAHLDHIGGLCRVREVYPGVPILVHPDEGAWLTDPRLNLSAYIGMHVVAPEPTGFLREGDELVLSGTRWKVLHTPGHSPGGITLWNADHAVALVGDTLFLGSVGRTDFPGSDFGQLESSIREKLYTMPGRTRVLPGHGPETSIAQERRTNPFVRV